MNSSRIMILNGSLFAIIVALALMNQLQERQLPGAPPLEDLKEELTKRAPTDSGPSNRPDAFPSLGRTQIFDTIIPLPTPTPKPTATPIPPPDIKDVTEFWKFEGPMKNGTAIFSDQKTREEIYLKPNEPLSVKYKGTTVNIYLKSIDKKKYTVIVRMNEMGVEQEREFSLL